MILGQLKLYIYRPAYCCCAGEVLVPVPGATTYTYKRQQRTLVSLNSVLSPLPLSPYTALDRRDRPADVRPPGPFDVYHQWPESAAASPRPSVFLWASECVGVGTSDLCCQRPHSPVCLLQRLHKKKIRALCRYSQGVVAALRTAPPPPSMGGRTSPSSICRVLPSGRCTETRTHAAEREAWLVNVQCRPVLRLR